MDDPRSFSSKGRGSGREKEGIKGQWKVREPLQPFWTNWVPGVLPLCETTSRDHPGVVKVLDSSGHPFRLTLSCFVVLVGGFGPPFPLQLTFSLLSGSFSPRDTGAPRPRQTPEAGMRR